MDSIVATFLDAICFSPGGFRSSGYVQREVDPSTPDLSAFALDSTPDPLSLSKTILQAFTSLLPGQRPILPKSLRALSLPADTNCPPKTPATDAPRRD